jgi:hypothetical protein
MLRLLAIGVAALATFFLIFWAITWITGSNDIGGWAALVLGFLGIPVLLLKLWPGKPAGSNCPEGKGLYPECLFVVTVSDSEVINKRPDGVIERIALKDLKEVAIETNSSGPWGADVWWLLTGATADARCAYPGGATGEQSVLQWLQRLPGFDDKAVIAAMGSTSNARFVCWQAAT